ncbi:hypothetical protein [Halosimplex marinum]|uniref:hypothetical protein n=1 Tax=Halosimplex marinum TaxID=3396620 RepID=UPI003F54F6CA
MSAVERFLKSRDLRAPRKDDNFEIKVAEQLDQREFSELVRQYKYAGRETLNYFIITGISDFDLSEIAEEVSHRLPTHEEAHEVVKEPFLAEYEQFGSRLYLAIGYYIYAGSEDPITGASTGVPITQRIVVVIEEDMDLVEIRGSDEGMVENVRDEICKALGKYKPSVKQRPDFGPQFQKEFNSLVETYFNLKVRVDDQEDSTLDSISFTSTEDEEGNRRDAREDDRVEEELSERGAEITMGYVELTEGFRFNINREKGKLSFTKAEQEEKINQVTEIIHNVLRETGEYTQSQISGIEDVPE